MRKTGHHGDDVVLDITKIHANVHTWCNLVVLVAAFGKALEDVGLAPEDAHQTEGVLAETPDPA